MSQTKVEAFLRQTAPRLCAPRGAAWAAACAAAASCRWRRSAAPCRPGPPCARPHPPPGPRTGTAAAVRLGCQRRGRSRAAGCPGLRCGLGVRAPYPDGCSRAPCGLRVGAPHCLLRIHGCYGSRCGTVHVAAAFTTGCARRPYADGSQANESHDCGPAQRALCARG